MDTHIGEAAEVTTTSKGAPDRVVWRGVKWVVISEPIRWISRRGLTILNRDGSLTVRDPRTLWRCSLQAVGSPERVSVDLHLNKDTDLWNVHEVSSAY